MKTLDEVIKAYHVYGRWVNPEDDDDDRVCDIVAKGFASDALHYLKMYRSDKLQWEMEKDYMQSRYQEAIDNCEKAENRFKAALKRLDIGTLNEPLT